jgi:hypothetical protein
MRRTVFALGALRRRRSCSREIKYDTGDKKWHANMNAIRDQLKAAHEFKYEGERNPGKS